MRQRSRKSRRKRPRRSPSVHQELGESLNTKPKFPVTCGNKEGILHKEEPCILSNGRWFTPTEFEKFGGKEKNKKWKFSILYNQIPLQTFIQDGFLSARSFRTKRSQDHEPACRKKLIRCRSGTSRGDNSHTSKSDSTSDSSSESDDDDDDDTFSANSYKVKCSSGRGVLHVNRFANETCGKCIRTQDAWLTPRDFLNLYKADGNWRRDIICQGVTLGKLIIEEKLKPHMVNCKCPICTRDHLHMLDQNNDDVCCKCNLEGDLVCCAKCPRAFHHHCHKPALRDDMISDYWT